jgi:hypothetical protein
MNLASISHDDRIFGLGTPLVVLRWIHPSVSPPPVGIKRCRRHLVLDLVERSGQQVEGFIERSARIGLSEAP